MREVNKLSLGGILLFHRKWDPFQRKKTPHATTWQFWYMLWHFSAQSLRWSQALLWAFLATQEETRAGRWKYICGVSITRQMFILRCAGIWETVIEKWHNYVITSSKCLKWSFFTYLPQSMASLLKKRHWVVEWVSNSWGGMKKMSYVKLSRSALHGEDQWKNSKPE